MKPPPETELRALDLFERLLAYPDNARFRQRLLRRETADVLANLARLEYGHAARSVMPTELPDHLATAFDEPPASIGPFRLTERIGYGGMGDVWRGERSDGLFDQTVAIKLIHRYLSARAGAAFEAERRILAKLDHPDIVRLTDGGATPDGRHYLIMDYVDGVPFDKALAALPIDQRIRQFRRLAAIVQFAHSRLIAHADLKPSNILVDGEDRIRLLDFGIAGLLSESDAGQAPTGAMTREFASPQRQAGAPPSVADDVFALGRLLTTIIGETADLDMQAVIAKACADDETDRYQTVAALSMDLEAWQTGFPVAACADTLAYRARKFLARHFVGVVASVMAVFVLIATTAYALDSAARAERARIEASARFDDARGTARYLLFTLIDRLEAQPNSLALRGEVARVAQHYLDRLSRAEGAPPEVRLEAARGLIRLAQAQGVPGYPNLAKPELAAANLGRAIALLKGLTGPEARNQLATALVDQAHVFSFVENKADVALSRLNQARALPGILATITARIANEKSAIFGWKSNYPAAAEAAQTALSVLPQTDTLDVMLERAKAQDLFAEATFYGESPKAAIEPYRSAMTTLEKAHRLYPTSRIVALRLARSRWALGSTLLERNDNARALSLLKAGSEELRSMVAFDSDDFEAARQLQIIELDRGNALVDLGAKTEGFSVLGANIAERRAWYAARPQEVRRLRDLAVGLKALADKEAGHGRRADACTRYAEVHQLVATMKTRADFAAMDMDNTMTDLAKMEARFCPSSAQKKEA